MMKLSTMLRVVQTIDHDRRSHIGELVAKPWLPDSDSVRFFRASANFVFRLTCHGQPCFLRFNHQDERLLEQVQAEVAIVNHLAAQGIAVARPMLSANGNFVETVGTELGNYHAVLFEGLSGRTLECVEMSEQQFHAWGSSLGQLHAALTSCPDALLGTRPDWLQQLDLVEHLLAPDDQAGRKELCWLKAWAAKTKLGSDDFGLIHYDFEQDNLVWQNLLPAILDFDDCARYPYIADIAYGLRDLFEEGVDLQHPSFLEFISGYQQHKSLNLRLLSELPTFLRLHNLLMYARLIRSTDLPTEYTGQLADLQQKLLRMIAKLQSQFSTV